MSFIAWMNWIAGLALADSARPTFRVMGGINRMFGVRRSLGSSGNLKVALILFALSFAVAGLGLFLTSSLRHRDSKLPAHLMLALPAAALALAYYLL